MEGGTEARFVPSCFHLSPEVVGSTPKEYNQNFMQWRGWHVESHVWATWNHTIVPCTWHVLQPGWSITCASHLPCRSNSTMSSLATSASATSSLPYQSLPHVSMDTSHISSMELPRHKYGPITSTIQTYHVSTIRTVQSTQIFLFGKANRTWYFSCTTSVWTYSSCIVIMQTRPTHESILKQFWELLFFDHFLIP